ncbi:MAG TPA: NUDIX domain-containing protein [Candidatus Acidoferrum sp.]|nr:NUDIX domain-containing protein [Candidatus Acidoferrum sp.]
MELNVAFAGAAEVIAFPRSEPRLLIASGGFAFEVDEPVRLRADAMRHDMDVGGRNETHAVMVGDPTWLGDPCIWIYQTVDFATITALRDTGTRFPPIITANVIACCAEKGLVYLLDRSNSVATYPNRWHIVGGNLTARGEERIHDREDLAHAASRELSEEMGVHVPIPKGIERVVALERSGDGSRDFVQLTYLGLNLDATVADRIKFSDEGSIAAMTLNELADALLNWPDRWVPSGRMQVLLWLAMGAPTFGCVGGFERVEARRIYECWRAAQAVKQS